MKARELVALIVSGVPLWLSGQTHVMLTAYSVWLAQGGLSEAEVGQVMGMVSTLRVLTLGFWFGLWYIFLISFVIPGVVYLIIHFAGVI
jgi:hypothetical protein